MNIYKAAKLVSRAPDKLNDEHHQKQLFSVMCSSACVCVFNNTHIQHSNQNEHQHCVQNHWVKSQHVWLSEFNWIPCT